MEIKVFKDEQQLSQHAAEKVTETIQQKNNCVLGLPTGRTPIGMYQELVEQYKRGNVDFSQVTTFNLDEYVGLSENHPQSYHYYMHHQLFSKVNVKTGHTHIPRGDAEDLGNECARYEQLIDDAGGMDLVILGIGTNGHIGFNEPGADAGSGTAVVELAQSTIQANSKYFSSIEQVPKQAITMGLKTILQKSKRILMLASGPEKAPIIQELLSTEKIDTNVPASLLKQHEDVTLLLDYEAAKLLAEKENIIFAN